MPFKASDLWTVEAVAILRDGYGKKTVTELANEIGCGRGAVVGKAFRLGLSAKKKPGWMPQRRAPSAPKVLEKRPMPAPKSNRQPPQVLPIDCWSPLPGCQPVTVYRLEAGHCRWPVTGGFCGCTKEVAERPYCTVHREISERGWYGVRNSQPSADDQGLLASAPSPALSR